MTIRMLFPALVAALALPVVATAQSLPAGVTERDITVSGPVALPGTLSVPAGKGPFPGVILVHGSGSGDRDETILGNKPFRDLAWGLAAQGVVVLRYDKRSKVNPQWFAAHPFTVDDEVIQDALSALTLLRQQPEVNPRRTFQLGLSLGGMLAPRIAKADGKVAGIIIMSGATRMQLIDQIDRQYAYLQSIAGADSMQIKAARAQLAPILAKVRGLTPADTANPAPIPGLGGTGARYWLDLHAYDPAVVMRDLKIPALVTQGLGDYQVPPDQLDDWLKEVGPRKDITVKRYPGLSHIYTPAGNPPSGADYSTPGHVAQQVIDDVAAWIKAH
ncbi:MAG TPA: alpha/beta hydrolase [Gemmatimonadales bacterium]|jgi:hypothetical protein|nr:alpha/beta hydrolase [Gemmatimonadales bacterium]